MLFAPADTAEALRRNLAAFAGPLALPQREATDESVQLQAVLDWLRDNPDWLLILDNVDKQDALEETLRCVGQIACGHVLITSRLDNFPPDIRDLPVDLLSATAAEAFLLERTGRRRAAADDPARARAICEELGYLALALEHAGAYIDTRRLGFAEYQELWRAGRDKVLAWADPVITGYPRSVAETDTNRLAEAEPLIRRALTINEKSFGPDHPNTAIHLSNLATLLHATSRLAEAEPLMRRALAIDEKTLGPEHPNVAIRPNNLAQLLRNAGRHAEAEPLMRRAVEILRHFEEMNGHRHPDCDLVERTYAGLLAGMKRRQK